MGTTGSSIHREPENEGKPVSPKLPFQPKDIRRDTCASRWRRRFANPLCHTVALGASCAAVTSSHASCWSGHADQMARHQPPPTVVMDTKVASRNSPHRGGEPQWRPCRSPCSRTVRYTVRSKV